MNIFYQIGFIVVTTAMFVGGNAITAQWAKTNNHLLWIPIFLCVAIGYVLFGFLVRQTNLAVGTGLVDALLVVASVLIGVFIFKDSVNAQQAVGLIFASLAVILLI